METGQVVGTRQGRRSLQRQMQGKVPRRAATLEETQQQPVLCRLQDQAQRRWRGLMGCVQGTDDDKQRVGCLGSTMQSTQGFGPHRGEPAQQGCTIAMLEHLVCGPQGIARIPGTQPEQLRRVQIPGRPAGKVGHVRRLYQDDGTIVGQGSQGGLQETDFTDPGMRCQQFDQ